MRPSLRAASFLRPPPFAFLLPSLSSDPPPQSAPSLLFSATTSSSSIPSPNPGQIHTYAPSILGGVFAPPVITGSALTNLVTLGRESPRAPRGKGGGGE